MASSGLVIFYLLLAAVATGSIWYSSRNWTFPTYDGKGSWGTAILVPLLGVALAYLISVLARKGNPFTGNSISVEYAFASEGLMFWGMVVFFFGMVSYAALTTWNLLMFGRAYYPRGRSS